MRLPNGFGSVYKLQGHRRRPWVVKKTIEGRQKALGYFETHDAALTFLLKVNHEPHGLTATFADIYQQWQASKWPTISKSSQSAYDISFRHLARLHDKPMSCLRTPLKPITDPPLRWPSAQRMVEEILSYHSQ